MNGWLITFEGPEGGGKSTQVQRLAAYLRSVNMPCILLREPGGTPIGDRIRQILLDPSLGEMTQRTEILLYAASRAQLVEERILPALKRGDVVLCDRFVDSSLVYQGYAPDWDLDEVKIINRMATGGLRPHRTYLLDLPVDESDRRLKKRGKLVDRIEQKGQAYHERVREGFLRLAAAEPQRYVVVDATDSEDRVFERIRADLAAFLGIEEKGVDR
ncbi:dTMP kinase [Polycladomyces subterraneus]|uniref:Thymidylate kinase n=1 Tax=Polycladomyces subterraneus TaxID=1016997 RepID=A0ABT8IL34_9BACL|nr:dTMP kinase [Polycladomyces subterraneus]MDN4593440.1 dTMP kinase [Polycladomyces subterraneus]